MEGAGPGGSGWTAVALALAAAYLLGSVPWGLVLVRIFRGVDLRQIGSGNIGATNAMRAAGRPVGLAVFALDFLKGLGAVALARMVAQPAPLEPLTLQVACGAASVLGHCYSAFLRLKGGKGVATGCGALVALDPLVFVAGGVAWLLSMALTRYAGLSSIAMGATFPIAAWIRDGDERPQLVVGTALLLVLILVRHRSNISRMLAGTEPKAFSRRAGVPPKEDAA